MRIKTIFVMLLLAILIIACKPSLAPTPSGQQAVKLDYSVSGCDTKDGGIARGPPAQLVDVDIAGNNVKLVHHLSYVCCAKVKVYLEGIETTPDETRIMISEKNDGEMCRCMCNYDVDINLGPLAKGKYTVQIFGVVYKDMPTEKLWEKEITIGEEKEVPPAPKPEAKIIVKQSGGAGMLIAECADKNYISKTADYILEGVVGTVESKWNKERTSIFTYTDFLIEKYVKGDEFAENKLQIVTPGGCADEICEAVEDQPIFHEGKKARLYFQKTDGEFSIVCAQFGVESLDEARTITPSPKESFCGTSTNGECSIDSDCTAGGCSGQVCQSKTEEPMITTCEYRDCYNAEEYGVKCSCASGACAWK